MFLINCCGKFGKTWTPHPIDSKSMGVDFSSPSPLPQSEKKERGRDQKKKRREEGEGKRRRRKRRRKIGENPKLRYELKINFRNS